MSLPISHFAIHGFRGLSGLELEECRPVNLLVGGNNSGKTSVLEALLLLANPLDIAQWEATVRLRRAWPFTDLWSQGSRLDRLDSLSWLFPRVDGDLRDVALAGKGDIGSFVASAQRILGDPPERPVVNPEELIEGRIPGRSDSELEAFQTAGLEIQLELSWSSAQVKKLPNPPNQYRMIVWERGRAFRTSQRINLPSVPAVFATPISHRSDGYLANRVSRLVRTKRKQQALELVQQIDPQLLDLVLVSPEDSELEGRMPRRGAGATLHVEHSSVGLIPIHALGDGIRRAVHLAALLAELGEGGLLLIDEIEVGMHTSVLGDVFKWLAEACERLSIQLFATTHSLEAVDAMLASVPDPSISLYRLKNQQIRRYEGDVLRTARVELGQEIR